MLKLIQSVFLLLAVSTYAQNNETAVYITDVKTGETRLLIGAHHPIFVEGGRCSRRPGCYLRYVYYTRFSSAWRCETKEEEACPWMF